MFAAIRISPRLSGRVLWRDAAASRLAIGVSRPARDKALKSPLELSRALKSSTSNQKFRATRTASQSIACRTGMLGLTRSLSAAPEASATLIGVARHWLGIYAELSKARLSALVVATTSAGFLFAGAPVDWQSFVAVTIGTSLAACSANTFNQIIERNFDALMTRTKRRPLPTGRVSALHAAGFAIFTGVMSTTLLAVCTNHTTAALGAFTIVLYAAVYTPMKRMHVLNTWVGAVVGAIPPVMGWTAAGGQLLSPESALLGSTLFLWQFPHFFALAWLAKEDYMRGAYKMIPVLDKTGRATAGVLMRYSLYMLPMPFVAYHCGLTTAMFPIESIAINGYMVFLSSRFYTKASNANAKRVFLCSLWLLVRHPLDTPRLV
eukprot:SAG11_NODE_201_length_12551_cov_67.866126_6_plen_378_part_00